jgi:hypothetical protein
MAISYAGISEIMAARLQLSAGNGMAYSVTSAGKAGINGMAALTAAEAAMQLNGSVTALVIAKIESMKAGNENNGIEKRIEEKK